MTIYDIAKEAGVSASTVSRVMNNKPGIKSETRERVLAVVNKYNFAPDETARGLVRQATKTIGLLVADVRITNYMMGIHTIIRSMAEQGYCCIVLDTGMDASTRAEYVKILSQRKVEGAILVGEGYHCAEVEEAIRVYLGNVPVVIISGVIDLPDVYSVFCDERSGMKLCFDYVFEKGYKHPVYIGCGSKFDNEQRLAGMADSVAKNAPGTDVPLYISDSPFNCGYNETRTALEEHPETDIIVYSADCFAITGMCMLQELGVKVPEQLGVITAEESAYSVFSHPYMTSLDMRIGWSCEVAGLVMLDILNGKEVNRLTVLTPQINERETTRNMD